MDKPKDSSYDKCGGKPKVAFFEFTSCEGCQLTVLNCEDELLPLFGKIEIVNFREAMSEPKLDNYEIAFVEGSITRESEIARLEKIRLHTKILVALGSCAHIGCVNIYKNKLTEKECRQIVYGSDQAFSDTIPARPLNAVVKVDFVVPGCPINKQEFLIFVQALLRGQTPVLPEHAVCVKCKLLENGCLLLKGLPCLGPVSKAGCNAICPSFGALCWGCRGTYPDANFEAHRTVLKEQKMDEQKIEQLYTIFQYQLASSEKV